MTDPIHPKAKITTAAIAADAPVEKPAELERPPLRPSDFGALRLELARRQLLELALDDPVELLQLLLFLGLEEVVLDDPGLELLLADPLDE